jgi:hypothetical protein
MHSINNAFVVFAALFCGATAAQPVLAPFSHLDRSVVQGIRVRGLAGLEQGNLAEADSLLSLADSAGGLDALDYLAWMSAKAALARYYDAGVLCCKAGAREPGLAAMACTRFFEIIKDKPVETRRLALTAYRQCALARDRCDTLRIKQWLSRAYGSYSMFTEETDLLRDLDTPHFPSGREFLNVARERFGMGFVAEAVVPAMEAFRRCPAAAEKSLAATIVYQCYLRIGKSADAALWLPRTELSDPRFRAQAVGFLQRAGLLDRADSLAAGLPPSVSRDTLAVRQALFTGNLMRAADLSAAIRGDRDAAAIWKIRTSVFSGRADTLEGWIDTLTVRPGWEYGREILAYRYKLELLKDSPEACGDFGAAEYALWLGQPKRAATTPLAAFAPMARQMLACDVVAALLEKNLADDAAKTVSQIPPDQSGPELTFYRGDILIRQGSIAEGSKVLEQLMLSHPGDVFAIKAKLILAHLELSPRH